MVEAISTVAYILNGYITKVHHYKTPPELWSGKKSTVSHFKIFGSTPVALEKTIKRKFYPKGWLPQSFIRYEVNEAEKRNIVIRRDVKLIKQGFLKEKRYKEAKNVIIEINTEEKENYDVLCEDPRL